MHVLISGICGFVGSHLAYYLTQQSEITRVSGFDNFARPGSWVNREDLLRAGVEVLHGDCRCISDVESLPKSDWLIDAAATPSVLAGIESRTSSRQLVETNLGGTLNLLEYCKRHQAGFVLLSTSRVYSIQALKQLPLIHAANQFELDGGATLPNGVTERGISETFSTESPISLYGATKRCSEMLAQEYSLAYAFPIQINRCGVLAGAGQFGRADQGIFAFWLHSWRQRAALKYLGFEGLGHQVRDCLHPDDLAELTYRQMRMGRESAPTIVNVSGGQDSATSLRQLSDWCAARWENHAVKADLAQRIYDVPWLVLDSSLASKTWNWQPQHTREAILSEIAEHAESHPEWLQLSQ